MGQLDDYSLLSEAESISHLVSPLALRARVMEAQNKPFRVRPHQKLISDKVRDAFTGKGKRFIAVSIAQQQGKALALDTPIPTPSGWTTIGDIKPGDEVFDDEGRPTTVVATTPVMEERPCYSIVFDTGEQIIADAEHLWRVSLDRAPRAHVRTLHTTKSLAKKRFSSPRLDNALPLQLPHINLPIDPYLLGVWLGDGNSNSANITQGDQDAAEVLDNIRATGWQIKTSKTKGSYIINGLFAHLRVMNLINNKHVPSIYLRASEEQRWSLVQGLIDSDGYVSPHGQVEFCTTREEILEGMTELLHSLGVKPMVKKTRATLYGRDIGPRWRVFFYHPNSARLTRKRERCREPSRQKHRYPRTVTEIPSVPVRCIQVAAKSGMYLCGSGMIPTHNSEITSVGVPEWVIELHSLGLIPGGLCGLISHEDSLSMSWSTKIRREIEACPDVFTAHLRKDSRAASYWETEQGGGMIAIGLSGSVQGRPLTFLGVDDPTKSMDQAQSANHQDKLWQHWISFLFGRLQPWTVVLVTMARVAPDDFVGRLKSLDYEGNPDHWEFIEIPYLAGEDDILGRPVGQPLQRPQADQTIQEAYEEAKLIQETTSPYIFQCMYQQDPRDAEGTILAESKWRIWGGDIPKDERIELPLEFDQVVMSWDMSFKDLKTSDWVVGTAWGRIGADYYLIDLVRGRWSFTETCNRVNTFAKRIRYAYKNATAIVVEDKANGPAVIDQLRSKVGGLVDFDPSDYGSKLARAHAIQPFQLGGNIYIPAESEKPWVRLFKKELADFRGTGRETDDQVDSTTMGILHMTKYQFSPTYVESGEDIDLTNLHATDVR